MPAAGPLMRTLAVLAAALLLTGLLAQTTLFQRVELWLGDAQQRLAAREVHFTRTLVVDIDEESLRRLEPYLGVWPYSRDLFAVVLDYLGELGTRSVGFDVLTSERRPGDAAFGEALKRNPDAVLAAVAGLRSGTAAEGAGTSVPPHPGLAWSLPAALPREAWDTVQWPTLAAVAPAVGIASLWPDVDGSVRRIPLLHRVGSSDLPALALALVGGGSARPTLAYDPGRGEVRVGEHRWPIDGRGRARLNFPRNAAAVPSIPFHALALAALGARPSPFTAETFAGRTVIIGSTALQTDAVHTPRGLMPGAYLLALAHENLAGDLLLRPPGAMATALLLGLALLLPVGATLGRPLTPAHLGGALGLGALLAWGGSLGLLLGWRQQTPLLAALLALLFFGAAQGALLARAGRRRRRHAEHQMRIAAAVFEASREGIFVTGADHCIVSINPAFTAITGYGADEVIGRNPNLLNSGRHDAAFFQAMWTAIDATGCWEGEIWNRRKNGGIYPQWLSIDTVRAADGSVDKRIAVFSDLSAHKAAEERIEFLAHFDPLTGLPNRTLLRDRVNVALAVAARTQSQATLMFLDLDRFRNVVESLGHETGDRVLSEIAGRLRALLGSADTLSRHGGDEFLLLLPGADAEAAAHLAGRILEAVARPLLLGDQELSLSVSIGIALFPGDGLDHDALTRSADSALHQAKQAGRNAFRFYAAEMHDRASEALLIESGLRHAVERHELLLHYQPQVDAVSGRLLGLEALLRWQHPQRGMVSPAVFIPVAEDCGLIGEIGDWVLRAALGQMRAWVDAGLTPVPVAVNLSLAQFRQPTLCDSLIDALARSGLAAGLLELELTESIAMENIAHTIGNIDRMRQLGIGLAIDDFGTGYSSLSYLKRFAVHKIKIDQSFVRNLSADRNDAAIVRAIIGLAHNLGFRVIAEGVETAAQLDFLRQWGCDEIQGYYFSRPLPAAQIEDLLRAGCVEPAGDEARQ